MRSPGFFDRHPQIPHAVELLRQLRQLVIVRSKQSLRARSLVDVLDHRPRQRQPIVRRGAAADLVQHDEAARRRRIENHGRFRHLHHESGAAARQVIRGADAREDAVDDRQAGRLGRHERPHLRQDRDQRGLPQIRGFAAHIRPGDDGDEIGIRH